MALIPLLGFCGYPRIKLTRGLSQIYQNLAGNLVSHVVHLQDFASIICSLHNNKKQQHSSPISQLSSSSSHQVLNGPSTDFPIPDPKRYIQKMRILRSLPMEFVVTNALMVVSPLEAMAETCEADQSLFTMNMPLLLLVALTGATVGGLVARQRKGELQRLNEQLRQINTALKRQAKIESYAPTLSYAPVGASKIAGNEVIVDPRKQDLVSRLKNGKNFLRNQDPDNAFLEFKAALDLSKTIKNPIEEKKAARGLGASLQRQGKYREAINYHSMVLSISEREGEDSGKTEAFGAIADCYTELGELDQAATFYDRYISRLEAE
ncbi:hypothetical protein OSB04_004924 [Centaurea solstitialis]|uniref:Uncharacterized protein n=1 Tax=Centaurea solstitialis TaxID=347529 RepID=A0AA38TGT1_9ASTR|nr:hypothetical protein OSB04_004924 [Centaurea solstitialis]